jgi:hypothetical protein
MKTFLLGVGCQKGGTTWLYDYLHGHPAVRTGDGKEYHVLDCLFLPQMSGLLSATRSRLAELDRRPALDSAAQRARQNLQNRLDFVANPEAYFDHFVRILQDLPDGSVTCDITPSYAALPEEAYRLVRDQLRLRGVGVKIVFLMREPVSRIYSHLRMLRSRSVERRQSCTEVEDVLKHYGSWEFEVRTRYQDTISNLERVFPAEDILYLFYEELFTDDSIRALCRHLGLAQTPAELSKIVNASPTGAGVPDAAHRRIRDHYQDTYDFVSERFSAERMGRLWPAPPGPQTTA